jgi:hypothetical protein
MEKITSREQLKPGVTFFLIEDDKVTGYEVVGDHPHNPAYILAIEALTQNAPKLYVPNLISGEYYLGPYDSLFVQEKELEYYKRLAACAEKRIEDIKKRREEKLKQGEKPGFECGV